MANGWIKLHRKLIENPIFKNAYLLQIFIYCLLKSNHEPNQFIFNKQMVKVDRGSFITGRIEMSKALKQSESKIYRNLKLLTKLGYISVKSNNKFSFLTVMKYDTYQMQEEPNEQQVNNKRTTSEQQVNTNKNDKNEDNDKNDKNDKKEIGDTTPNKVIKFSNIPPSIDEILEVCRDRKYSEIESEADKFFNYYEANGWKTGRNPVKNWGALLSNWFKNSKQFNNGNSQFKRNGSVGRNTKAGQDTTTDYASRVIDV